MRKIKLYWILVTVYCLLPVIFALSLSLFVRRLPDVGQPRENTQTWVYQDHPVSQTFTPQNNGLNLLTVYLKNVSLRNQDPLTFSLSDSSGIIREIKLSGYNIGDGDNVPFQFEPISDSSNKSFKFTFTSSSPKEIAIGVGYSEQDKSVAYQSYFFPTNRYQLLKTATIGFILSLFQPRFLAIVTIVLVCTILLQRSMSARSA